MRPEAVVVPHIFIDSSTQFARRGIVVDVYVFCFQATEPALNNDIIHPPGPAIHTLAYAVGIQGVDVSVTGELAALVRTIRNSV